MSNQNDNHFIWNHLNGPLTWPSPIPTFWSDITLHFNMHSCGLYHKSPGLSGFLGFLLYKAVNNVHCSKCHLDEINAKELHLYGVF